MSAQSFPYRTCPYCDKRGYDSRKIAKAVLRRMSEAQELQAYICPVRPDDDPFPFAWHVGHRVPASKRNIGRSGC